MEMNWVLSNGMELGGSIVIFQLYRQSILRYVSGTSPSLSVC